MSRRKNQGRRPSPRLMQQIEQLPLPPRLYKFLPREWASAMMSQGSIRIGTLHEYRDQEKHPHMVGDAGEGTVKQHEAVSAARGDQLGPVAARTFNFGEGTAQRVTIEGISFVATSSEPDQNIYCLSKSASWGAEIDPNYTACIEIHNLRVFLLAMLDEVQWKYGGNVHLAVGDVLYAGREHITHNDRGVLSGGAPTRPAFLKPPEYSNQQEFRFVFTSSPSVEIKPIFAKIRAIAPCISLHSVRPN